MCEVAYPVNEALVCGLDAVTYSVVSIGVVLGSAIYFDSTGAGGIFLYGIITSIILLGCTLLSFLINGIFIS